MKYRLDSPNQLGELVRATRKHQGLRQDLLADMLGVSENFMGRLENGEVSMQWGKLFKVLELLGIRVTVDLPEGAEEKLTRHTKPHRSRLDLTSARSKNEGPHEFNAPSKAMTSWEAELDEILNAQLQTTVDKYAAFERTLRLLGKHLQQLQAEARPATQLSPPLSAGNKGEYAGETSLRYRGTAETGDPVHTGVGGGGTMK